MCYYRVTTGKNHPGWDCCAYPPRTRVHHPMLMCLLFVLSAAYEAKSAPIVDFSPHENTQQWESRRVRWLKVSQRKVHGWRGGQSKDQKKGAGGLNPWKKKSKKYKKKYASTHFHDQCPIYVNLCNLCTVRLKYASPRRCSRAGCLRWSSSWAPPPVGCRAACGRLWTSPPVTPGLAGACGGSGAQRTAPRPPP